MSSLFSITKQKVLERVGAASKTVDSDFERKKVAANEVEAQAKAALAAVSAFAKTLGAADHASSSLSNFVAQTYKNDTDYSDFGEVYQAAHKTMTLAYKEVEQQTLYITSRLNDFLRNFDVLREKLKERDRVRVVYDHYVSKVVGLKERKNSRLKHEETQKTTEVEKLTRNNQKFQDADRSFHMAHDDCLREFTRLTQNRAELLDPILIDIMKLEVTYYTTCTGALSSVQKLPAQIEEVHQKRLEAAHNEGYPSNTKYDDEQLNESYCSEDDALTNSSSPQQSKAQMDKTPASAADGRNEGEDDVFELSNPEFAKQVDSAADHDFLA
eukprot:GILJ01000779.1.p1 GENE.GILJ01000779.1~~GILJ01000779.1.p1  ORF type:complete len:327 (-),score=60.68 GILJ01000779.1:179-1159(-)